MPQAASPRPLVMEANVQSQASPCDICGGQIGTGTGFPRVFQCSCVNSILPVHSITYNLSN
jgi:hypothetical protein